MLHGERLQRLHGDLIALRNERDLGTVLAEDLEVLLSSLGRYMPPGPTVVEVVDAERAAKQELATGVQAALPLVEVPQVSEGAPSPLAGKDGADTQTDTAPAPGHETASKPSADAPSKRVDVGIRRLLDGGVDVFPNNPEQELSAQTIRALLSAVVGRKLTPLGAVGFDLVLALERRDVEVHQFLGQFQAGKAILEAAVDFQTPSGQAVAQWFNALSRWQA